MADNLNIKGITPDDKAQYSGLRFRSRKRRKPFKIEGRIPYKGGTLTCMFGLDQWSTWSRYETESRRDEALAVLVKKAVNEDRRFYRWEYRAA